MNRLALILILASCGMNRVSAADPNKSALAQKAQAVFASYCYKCHGEGGRADGGFNYVTELKKLVDTKKVTPGDARKSKLFKYMTSDDNPMPPEVDDNDTSPNPVPPPKPSKDEIDVVRQWIAAGAPDLAVAAGETPRPFLSESDIVQAIADDLKTVDDRYRRFIRYFTLTHLYNAGLSADELLTYRNGLSKLVNSLSWGRKIVVPKPVDPAETVFRIDLRDFKWDDKIWQAILSQYPYGLTLDTPPAKGVYSATHCELPYVRADWFVFAASKPPLYHDVLQLPKTDRELEDKLQIDVDANIRRDLVARAGFNDSGVSLENNRMIERHESDLTNGAYWKSYDFAVSTGFKNLFAYPLGPAGPVDASKSFQHDGGEIIFNLPNGLQAYLLVKANGERLDVAPIKIVRDNAMPGGEVTNGISCMHCHFKGMIEKDDQIAASVAANAKDFPEDVVASVAALYPPKARMDALLKEDTERFVQAVKLTGASISKSEAVFTLARKFESELDIRLAASETGVPVEAFDKLIRRAPALAQTLGVLRTPGGRIKREVFVDAFPTIVRVGALGALLDLSGGKRRVSVSFEGSRPGDERDDNGLGMKFCWTPARTFMMGSPLGEPNRDNDEAPISMTLTHGAWVGKYEVTQGQWFKIMGTTIEQQRDLAKSTTLYGTGDDHPMYYVNQIEAEEFARKLTDQEHKSGKLPVDWEYRLPTEAEWESACRGEKNKNMATAFGDSLGSADANLNGKFPYNGAPEGPYLEKTCAVGSYKPNDWGLHDMHGNVMEWCRDGYDATLKGGNDPQGAPQAPVRVIRGGSWFSNARDCRSAKRYGYSPEYRSRNLGFRLAAVQSVR